MATEGGKEGEGRRPGREGGREGGGVGEEGLGYNLKEVWT